MILSYQHRLYPTRTQAAALEVMLGAFCALYNAALQQRIEAYRRQGRTLRYADQAAELKAVRAADERLAGFSFSAEQQVLRRLDKAFAAFFRRLKAGGKAVHNAVWATLAGMIAYKAAKAGGQVVLVDPRGTSRTCPECGTYAPKTLAQREHRCACGCTLDRNVAAPKEILRRAEFSQPGTGGGTPSQRVAA